MKINDELIRRCSSRNLLPQESQKDLLLRITHLYLQEQHIGKIENLEGCRNLVALYLYDNRIERIENLDQLAMLSCLYLQGNAISRIQNLDFLLHLTILNLSQNAIERLEGLEALSELKELYLQYQALSGDQELQFDPSTLSWLSNSLRILNVSGNRLRSLEPLAKLVSLEVLLAEDNQIDDLQDLVQSAHGWTELRQARLVGNPVCRTRKYRDSIVITCMELEELDGKVITAPYRNFLLNWKQCQTLQDRKRESYTLLKPFLNTQLGNKQLTPPRHARSASVSRPGRSGSLSSSQSESSVRSEPRSRSGIRVRSLQDMIRRRSKDA